MNSRILSHVLIAVLVCVAVGFSSTSAGAVDTAHWSSTAAHSNVLVQDCRDASVLSGFSPNLAFGLDFEVPCSSTAATTAGSTCALATSLDALTPGAVPEGKRSIWALGQVEVDDANGAPFMRQGVFVP